MRARSACTTRALNHPSRSRPKRASTRKKKKAASPLLVPARSSVAEMPLEQAIDLVKDAFVSAGERDIYTVRVRVRVCACFLCVAGARDRGSAHTRACVSRDARALLSPLHEQGDAVEIVIITKEGVRREMLELKKD